jgi:hypothetical protein
MIRSLFSLGLSIALFAPLAACGGDDNNGATEADKHGIGSACTGDPDCFETGQTCLAFKGGYCGVANCTGDVDCPDGSRCIAHTDGTNYCFRTCVDKTDCNFNRPLAFESNCSSNVTFVSGGKGSKACVPPS